MQGEGCQHYTRKGLTGWGVYLYSHHPEEDVHFLPYCLALGATQLHRQRTLLAAKSTRS